MHGAVTLLLDGRWGTWEQLAHWGRGLTQLLPPLPPVYGEQALPMFL